MPVVLSNPNGPFDLQFVTIEGLVKEEVKGQVSLQMAGERLLKRKTEEEEAPVKQAREEIERLFSWKYPFEAGRKSGGQLLSLIHIYSQRDGPDGKLFTGSRHPGKIKMGKAMGENYQTDPGRRAGRV